MEGSGCGTEDMSDEQEAGSGMADADAAEASSAGWTEGAEAQQQQDQRHRTDDDLQQGSQVRRQGAAAAAAFGSEEGGWREQGPGGARQQELEGEVLQDSEEQEQEQEQEAEAPPRPQPGAWPGFDADGAVPETQADPFDWGGGFSAAGDSGALTDPAFKYPLLGRGTAARDAGRGGGGSCGCEAREQLARAQQGDGAEAGRNQRGEGGAQRQHTQQQPAHHAQQKRDKQPESAKAARAGPTHAARPLGEACEAPDQPASGAALPPLPAAPELSGLSSGPGPARPRGGGRLKPARRAAQLLETPEDDLVSGRAGDAPAGGAAPLGSDLEDSGGWAW